MYCTFVMFPISYKLNGRPVLVIGGGDVATSRVDRLLHAKAETHVVCDKASAELKSLATQNKLCLIEREYKESDLDAKRWAMVLSAIDDHEMSEIIGKSCRRRRIPVNVADMPDYCDFYFGATIYNGPLEISISTGGLAPRMTRRIRATLEAAIADLQLGNAIENVGQLRAELRRRIPEMDSETVKRRMAIMTEFCDSKTYEELAALDVDNISELVKKLMVSDEPIVITNGETGDPTAWTSLNRASFECVSGSDPELPPYPFKQPPLNRS